MIEIPPLTHLTASKLLENNISTESLPQELRELVTGPIKKYKWEFHRNNRVKKVTLSPQNKILALILEDGTFKLLSTNDGQENTLNIPPEIINNYRKDLSYLDKIISSDIDQSLRETLILERNKLSIRTLALNFSPDERYLAINLIENIIGEKFDILIYDLIDKQIISILRASNPISSTIFHSNCRYLILSSHTTIQILDITKKTAPCILKLEGHEGIIYNLISSPDSRYLASSSNDKTIRIWDLNKESDHCINIIKDNENLIHPCTFTSNNQYLLVIILPPFILKILDLDNKEDYYTLPKKMVDNFSPSHRFGISTKKNKIKLFNFNKNMITSMVKLEDAERISEVSFSSDERYLIIVADNKVIIQDTWKDRID